MDEIVIEETLTEELKFDKLDELTELEFIRLMEELNEWFSGNFF